MTDTVQRRGTASSGGRPEFRIREVRDRRVLAAALSEDRAFSAYALGYLEDELFPSTRFWMAEGDARTGVVVHARALGPSAVFVGDPLAVSAILSVHPGPAVSYLSTAAPAHMPHVRRWFEVGGSLAMRRMSVTAATFRPAEGPVRRLRGFDVDQINGLYATEGGPSNYSRHAIERAVYFGIFAADRLVAVAGTHIVAPNESIAVVGNVFTHPRHRGRGLATQATSAVTTSLLEAGCAEVVLTVDPRNDPAVAAYHRLGYRLGTDVVEARLRRRDLLGFWPAWRRYRARIRGHRYGDDVEVVRPNMLEGEAR